MAKKPETILREYARRTSDEDLRYLQIRFSSLMAGDRAEIANLLSKDKEVDKVLASAISAEEWFEFVDIVGSGVFAEAKKRKSSRPPQKKGIVSDAKPRRHDKRAAS